MFDVIYLSIFMTYRFWLLLFWYCVLAEISNCLIECSVSKNQKQLLLPTASMASNLFLLRSVSPNKWNRKVSFFVSFSSSFQYEEQECVDMGKNIAPDAELHFYIVKDRFVRITLYTESSYTTPQVVPKSVTFLLPKVNYLCRFFWWLAHGWMASTSKETSLC